MINAPDPVSSSYTESISSELHRRMEEDELHHKQQSAHSNLSNLNYDHRIPIGTDKSSLEISDHVMTRTPTNSNGGPSTYYDSIGEENSMYSQDGSDYENGEDDKVKITPLPRVQMIVISILLFSEPLTSTILFPFIYSMLKDFHLSDDEKEIGSYAGWITSVFFIAQFSTAIVWGKISDRYGRRPVLLTGLIGNSISTCLFGLSKNLWWAIGARALCGIMNGNSGVARSTVSEITDNTNKAKAFSVFSVMWNTGMIGPTLGGYLSKPAENFPELFGNCQFLKDYPYFLPCFVSACGSMIGFTIGYFYLEESNPNVIASKKWDKDRLDNERTALLKNDAEVSNKKILPRSGSIRNITMTSFVIIIANSVFGFHAMVFDEILPLYFTAPTYAGGLGISLTEFAQTLAILGVAQLIFQFGVYPKLTQRFNILVQVRVALFMFVIVYTLFPELSTLREWSGARFTSAVGIGWIIRIGYLSLLLIRFFGNCMAFTGLNIMVSTSATSEILGTVNG
ncbi:major facilitator superfamily domain-containing protein [Mucor mucedo]|uniref:major facilitator superfamily domain-containing protein n=1 Tax=Mucor mucedo TaxID=29922 RepID=UPI00221EFFC1|nr:major facilitator superfamily domain-containing protein [Mucor mucedo]KAI7895104.1 major facilitator superfamily domain-containing protein [Mucor mucedo]